MFLATGLSITAGYHRLFTHVSYKANPLIRLFYLVFGACRDAEFRLKLVFGPPAAS